ncbi:uncharacterized protein HMPREF1541_03197 [Cyphellophora europaea CBS 101466]|uniref:Uncharacterized protein n=1 Tax=Cyphellophora europaea (strain CBS 101466) TaxID=1220924 RepID=W2RXT9_CYPE1|nr:uncharacterized protein HMPREF1541_03197 [Cyphellophora europaea CBS 101466]ETN41262.1 hypothetical protein HMPREF1541_03197 [Cyphellophora europaea CBS 101466]
MAHADDESSMLRLRRPCNGMDPQWQAGEGDAAAEKNTTTPSTKDKLSNPYRQVPSSWVPYTLRKRFLAGFIAYTLVLGITTAVLHFISSKDMGLADEQNSTVVYVGSKFVPTLLAVLYLLLATMLLDDVKRTEAFARLSRREGAPADVSVFQHIDAWWSALFNSFPSRPKQRPVAWTMLSATLLFVLSFLVLSPFSSTLVESQDVVYRRNIQFARLPVSATSPLDAEPDATTYFRSISNILQNVSTSAWITNEYAIVPFWPHDRAPPLGLSLGDESEYWTSETAVIASELSCERLELTEKAIVTGPDGYIQYPTITLSNPTCSYTLLSRTSSQTGTFWSNRQNLAAVAERMRLNLTAVQCSEDSVLVSSSPWQDSDFEWVPELRASGYACNNSYSTATLAVTAALEKGAVSFSFDKEQYQTRKMPLDDATFNVSAFTNVFYGASWGDYLVAASKSIGERAPAEGPAALATAIYEFNPLSVMDDTALMSKANKVQQRFMGELLHQAYTAKISQQADEVDGEITSQRRRLVVVPAVAILLEATLTLQLCLLVAVVWCSVNRHRPLGLEADPASVHPLAALITKDSDVARLFRDLQGQSPREAAIVLRKKILRLWNNELELAGSAMTLPEGHSGAKESRKLPKLKSPIPWVFRLAATVSLCTLLLAIMVVIVTLFGLSESHGLFQEAFVYETHLKLGSTDLGAINPASVLSTFLAVCVGLWWGALDGALRQLQPFLSLAEGPTSPRNGGSLSYRSSYLVWAAVKAFRRKHWVLACVCMGALQAEIFTVAMSALWDRSPGALSSVMETARPLEIRQIPYLTTGDSPLFLHSGPITSYQSDVLAQLYDNLTTSWMYGAAVQLVLNGSQPAWSSEGWSFAPVDFPHIVERNGTTPIKQGNASTSDDASTGLESTLISLDTSAIRGRIECSPYAALDDESNWITEQDLSNTSTWTVPDEPKIGTTMYQLGCKVGEDGSALEETYLFNLFPNTSSSEPCSGEYYTGFFANQAQLSCCQNVSGDTIGDAYVGYWSPNYVRDGYRDFPVLADTWPVNFTIKWIYGQPVEEIVEHEEILDLGGRLMWVKPPRMQALNCRPIVETANARVKVDPASGAVDSYTITDTPVADDNAWREIFARHAPPGYGATPSDTDTTINVTVSHGVLFIGALLGAADLNHLSRGGGGYWNTRVESLDDRTYNIRLPGLNVDYMSYSMLSLANNDHQALLSRQTLGETAQTVFSTFFQHYASNRVSSSTGGWVYQPRGAELPAGIDQNGNENKMKRQTADGATDDATATLHVSQPVEMLRMSPIAAGICIAILTYLIGVTIAVMLASRKYARVLHSRIQSVADIAALVAGSDKLLQLLRERPLLEIEHDDNIATTLGWFVGGDGKVRWGVELAGPGSGTKFLTQDEAHALMALEPDNTRVASAANPGHSHPVALVSSPSVSSSSSRPLSNTHAAASASLLSASESPEAGAEQKLDTPQYPLLSTTSQLVHSPAHRDTSAAAAHSSPVSPISHVSRASRSIDLSDVETEWLPMLALVEGQDDINGDLSTPVESSSMMRPTPANVKDGLPATRGSQDRVPGWAGEQVEAS